MEDIQEQLAALRRRIAQVDRKFAEPVAGMVAGTPRVSPGLAARRVAATEFIHELMSGEVVSTPYGEHFETEKVWERHRRHGSVDISDLAELPEDLLDPLSAGAIRSAHPTRWAFLDTETTGLAGGTGTYAFLIGVGSIDAASDAPGGTPGDRSGFRLRQFFMRDYGEEASLLWRLAEYLARFDVLITYNGKAYDQPLLETRFRMVRRRHPFDRMEHLDLLFAARRLWKLRLESCRLVDLENRVLGVERHGDLPGSLIPYCYFDYLRSRRAMPLIPIFDHNATDILSLACLTAIVPFAFRTGEGRPLGHGLRHGADLIGLGRWMLQAERQEEALELFRRAVEMGLPDDLLFRAMWDIASMEKRLGRSGQALEMVTELAASRNPYRVRALEELAKHYEHSERNYAMALEMTRAALTFEDCPQIRRREQRLKARMERPGSRRLAL
ncbi:MAG TPA: ribonuclease H-like domain-containing protein [Candidatus Acidoferrales bacterium]|nr:ribonuclease H-like domain-containing protein [Candidatus Acidoferrales bacterium]